MKFHILIFGCQMNYADSARIKAVMVNCGFSYTENSKDADIIIFDTCSVRQKSEDKITGKLNTIRPDQKIRITGCMIQHNLRSGKVKGKKGVAEVGNFIGAIVGKKNTIVGFTTEEINDISDEKKSVIPVNNAFNPIFYRLHETHKNIELMRRIDDTGFLPLMLKDLGYKITYDQQLINEYEKIIPENISTSMNIHKKTAYVPISTGCNQFCAYCIVPYARGLEKYFSVEQIVNETKEYLKNGAEEIVLLGQIVNKHPEFITIIKKILKLTGLKRLRYTSPYPTYYTKELLSLHEKEQKLCPHIHIPLQSGSDTILKKMFRGYTLKQAKEFIDNIRKLKRNISITTDIIVGFPDETEDDFKQTLELAEYGEFDMIYIGIYSQRPGTLAAKNYTDNISRKVKRERRNKLNILLKNISRKNNEKEIGSKQEVLINKISKGIIEGYTENMKQILIEKPLILKKEATNSTKKNRKLSIKIGEFITVKIIKILPFKLYGEII